jgi:cob(I)alamin adenosyltransferase
MAEHHVNCSAIMDSLHELHRKVDKIMTVQADIDAATAALTVLTTDVANNVAQLQTDVTNIQAQLAALPGTVDTSALDAAVSAAANTAANLDAAVAQVTAL